MNGDSLSQFTKAIQPLRSLWQSARISGVAVNINGRWISLGLRLSLSELLPVQLEIKSLPSYGNFVYFDGRCSAEYFDCLAEGLVHQGCLTLQPNYSATGGSRTFVYLNRQAAAEPATGAPGIPATTSWFYGDTLYKPLPGDCGTDRPGFLLSADGERDVDILNYSNHQKIDSTLLRDTPYRGWTGLLTFLLPGCNTRYNTGNVRIQIVAPLPLFLESPDPTKLKVRAPQSTPRGALGLKCFFDPEGVSEPKPLSLEFSKAVPFDPDMIEWNLDIPWPEGSTVSKAHLFYLDVGEIASLEINRMPPSVIARTALDDYFDPDRQRLLECLGIETRQGKKKSQNEEDKARKFELAVARLMNLLGVPLIWYGKWLGKPERSDLGGVIETEGTRVAILGECTASNPAAKFSGLRKRADELAENLGGNAEIVAVVFTSAKTTESETQQARQHEIALVGREELGRLLDSLKHSPRPSKVLDLLRNVKSSGPINPWLPWEQGL